MHLPNFITTLLFFIAPVMGRAQATDTLPPRPPFREAKLQLHYFNIDWTDRQWDTLAGSPMRLEFYIDEIGEPFLTSARGQIDSVIFDSLRQATYRLPYFTPASVEGDRVAGRYLSYLTFPGEPLWLRVETVVADLEKLDSTHVLKRNAAFAEINGHFVKYLGTVGSYLHAGGGFDMLVGARWTDRWAAGFNLGADFMKRRRPFPEDEYPDRDDQSSTSAWFGGLLDYSLVTTKKCNLSLRTELGYGQLSAADRLEDNDREGQLLYHGVHTGVTLQYSLRLSDYRPIWYSGPDVPGATSHNLNIVGGYRYRYYGNDQARGGFYFIGIGYRFARDEFVRRQ